MRIRVLATAAVAGLTLLALATDAPSAAASPGGRNLLANPGVESVVPGANRPRNWTPDTSGPGATLVSDQTRPHGGRRSVRITAPTPNDARWTQTVAVQRDTRYRLSGWIRTSRVAQPAGSAGGGATLGVLGRPEHTPAVLGTTGWRFVTTTVDSGDATSLVIAARLGSAAGPTTGTAWFDDLLLERTGRTPPVARWKVLVLIYPKVDLTWTADDGTVQHVTSQITPAEQKAAGTAARTFLTVDLPALSSGNATATATVRTVRRTLTQLDRIGEGWWPGPSIAAPELDPAFDAAIVIWQPMGVDAATGQPRWFGAAGGLTWPTGTGQAYSSMMLGGVVGSDSRNVFKHEFGHSLVWYFEAAGTAPSPAVNNHSDGTDYVHCGTGEHYVWVDETLSAPVPNSIYNNTSGFTHAYYSGTPALADAPGTCLGITRAAWASGTPLTHRQGR